MKLLATLLATIGTTFATLSMSVSPIVLIDEPECPKHLIK